MLPPVDYILNLKTFLVLFDDEVSWKNWNPKFFLAFKQKLDTYRWDLIKFLKVLYIIDQSWL